MKRDFELIRKLLLCVEGESVDLSSYTNDQILYHKALLLESGLAEGPKPHYASRSSSEIPDKVIVRKLTWAGHDLIDGIRDEDRWKKVKKWLKDTGKIITLEALKEAVKAPFS